MVPFLHLGHSSLHKRKLAPNGDTGGDERKREETGPTRKLGSRAVRGGEEKGTKKKPPERHNRLRKENCSAFVSSP